MRGFLLTITFLILWAGCSRPETAEAHPGGLIPKGVTTIGRPGATIAIGARLRLPSVHSMLCRQTADVSLLIARRRGPLARRQ